jgi:hypothetical protein
MANEYRRLDGAGVGLKRGEKELVISVANMNSGGALTLGTSVVLGVVWLATATEPQVMEALEHAKNRVVRHFATTG